MKYFKIGYGCGCGDNEDYITAKDEKAAVEIAWEYARDDYESYEGYHGIRDMHDIAEEDFGISLDEADEATYDDIEAAYIDERELQLDYWAEEITEKEYLIGIGELEEDMSKKIVRHITTDCCYYTEEDGKTVVICGAHLTPELDGKFWEEVSEYKEKIVTAADPHAVARSE